MMLTFLLTFLGLGGLFSYLLIYLLVLHPEKGERVGLWISNLTVWASNNAKRTRTSLKIQKKIQSFASNINTEVENLLPYELKIKWTSTNTNNSSFIEANKVIVFLPHSKNQDENLARVALLYMNKAVTPDARPHIDNNLSTAIDMMMTKKALYSFHETGSSLDYFVRNILNPSTNKNSELKEYCEVIEIVDEKGLFTRILLRELLSLGRKRGGRTETGDSVHEANLFVKHLKKIAEKERGVDVDPSFFRKDIRVGIILVARSENIKYGEKFYVNSVRKYGIKQSAPVIYISAINKNIEFAKNVVRLCEKEFGSFKKIHEEDFPIILKDGKTANAYCGILYNPNRKII